MNKPEAKVLLENSLRRHEETLSGIIWVTVDSGTRNPDASVNYKIQQYGVERIFSIKVIVITADGLGY